MSFKITGTLHKKFETESKSDSFQAREFVVKVNDNGYENFVKFQLVQDRCSAIDPYEEGQTIKVHFDLRGREWNDKYFTNLNAWRVEKPVFTNPPAVAAAHAEQSPPMPEQDDDLPF